MSLSHIKLLTGTALLPLLIACGSGTDDPSGGGDGGSDGATTSAGQGTASGSGAGGTGAGGPGGAGPVEDSGAGCPRPTLPDASSLPAYEAHHDPFLMLSGSRITKKSEWACRRAEIKAQVEEYESGPKPAVSRDNVTAEFSGKKLTVNVSEGGKSVSFSIDIERPAGAPSGPIPLLISFYGFGAMTLDASVFSQNGVATAVYNNNNMGAQSGGGSRGTGIFYDLYGKDHPASSMIAWAWGISRIIDALEKTPGANIDPRRVAVTGCSRDGKGALTAGAFDERIALTIPQESGAGGSASWRVSQAASSAGENVQTLSHAAGEQPWFRASFGSSFGSRVSNLPFDHHMVMGLVAPRALLVLDNRIDWLGIDSTFTAGSIAHAIWEGLGAPDTMGYSQLGGHQHCQFPAAQRGILEAYVKKFLVGGGTDDTSVLEGDGARADLARWMTWTPPALE
ncbi:glucuronyl esterase domain-containing protein [Sorangium sp. So ce1335]|uniref:glucuronyl esterase domain-containing protein n=1 Tax=Sorangium sp. So ce1335 TaxID=3133335 RepID=UPI003F5FFE25